MPDASSSPRPDDLAPDGPCRELDRHLEKCLAEIEASLSTAGASDAVGGIVGRLHALRTLLADRAAARGPDVALGRRLMETLLPGDWPTVQGLEVAGRVSLNPAVGGNVCLLLPVNASHLIIVVLDASGQGLPVACLSAWAAVALARDAFTGIHSPRVLLNRLNRRLLARPDGRYLRAFVADLDLDLMEMTYVNASHCEPLWLRGERIESVDTQGLFVGLFEDAAYEERTLQLAEGDGLVFYSDAVVDALRRRAGLVESAGLLSLVRDHLQEDAPTLVEALAAEVEREGRQHHDDVVILALRCQHVEDWRSMVIPSDSQEGKRIADVILEHLTLSGVPERVLFAMKLALEEGLTNAIKHGNKGDPTKRVHVRYSICPNRVVIIITDEGPGFNPAAIPDPTAEDRLELPTGRGILLMRAYMDAVEYNAAGNQVKLTCLKR